MTHAAAPSEVTDATIGSRAARVLAIVGSALAIAATVAYGWLIAQAITDPGALTILNSDLRRTSGRTGPYNTSTLITIEALSVLGFLLGVVCLGMADVSRRRVGRASYTKAPGYVSGSGFQYPVRPIGWGWQVLWIALLALGWVLAYAVPYSLGVLRPGTEGYLFLLILLFIPLTLSAATCLAAVASLVKKLSYGGQLHRHPDHPTSPKRGALRTFLYLWRGDLALAAVGGFLAGISIWPATTGQAIVAVGFLFWGALFFIAGVAFGLQYWRTGEPLALVTITRPPANGALFK